jgi:hypothetical protein
MSAPKKRKGQGHLYDRARILAAELDPTERSRVREDLLTRIRTRALDVARDELSRAERDTLASIAIQLTDVLIELPFDLVTVDDEHSKGLRRSVCDLTMAAILVANQWPETIVRGIVDAAYEFVQDSPFGRYVP